MKSRILLAAACLLLPISSFAQGVPNGGGRGVPSAATSGLIPNIQIGCGGDATAAIQAALNGAGYAVLPACPQSNPLLVSATINMPNYSTLCGQGHTATWIKEPNSANLAPIIQGNNSAGGANIQLNNSITVCGLSIDGNGVNQSNSSTIRCIDFLGVADIKIHDVGVTNCRSDAVFVNGNGAVIGPGQISDIFINGTIGPGPAYGYGLFVAHAQRWTTIKGAYVQNTAETAILDDASETSWSDLYANNTGGSMFTGTGSGTNLTVTGVTGRIIVGSVILGNGVPFNTTITAQQSGTTGGAGVYTTSAATTSSATPIIAIGNFCTNAGTTTVNNPGGGGASQSSWLPCPAGIWLRNVTNVTMSNWVATQGSYYGMVVTGARHSSISSGVATNNSLASTGVWDDVHYDFNVFLGGYGEDHAITMTGVTVGANGQTLASTNSSTSPATSRYGIFINDGLPGSMGDASVVSGGSGYVFNDNVSCSGGTETELCKFTVAAAPGGVIRVPGGLNVNTNAGSGVYTVLPANPVALTGGTGTGATVNITWSSAYITGVNCGQTVTACSRIPAFSTNWTVQTNP